MGSTSIAGHRSGRRVKPVSPRAPDRLLAAVLALTALACATPTAREPAAVRERTATIPVRADAPVLRVGTSGDYAPFSQWSTTAPEPEGFSVAVARAFARATGRRIEWIRFEWPTLARDLEAGRFDLALSGITTRADRSQAGRFSLPLATSGAVALVAADSTLARVADLDHASIRIAVNRGGHLERVARETFARARIDAVEPNERVPERLARGRADAVVTDAIEAPHWQAKLPPTRVIGPFTRDRKAAWLPIGHASLARELDLWLLEAERSGELAALRRRYGLPEERTAQPLPALLAKLDERLALMPAVALAKRALGRGIEDAAQEERVQHAARRAADAAAQTLGVPPPDGAALRRFVDVQLRAARFVQARVVAAADRGADASAGSSDDSHAGSGSGEDSHAQATLETRLRPAIAHLTEQCIWLVVAAAAAAGEPPRSERDGAIGRADVAAALARHALPEALLAELHAALEALVKPPRASRAERARPAGSAPRARAASA